MEAKMQTILLNIQNLSDRVRERRKYKRTDEYRSIRIANLCFFFCIIFEVAGIFTMPFFGTLGAQMAIYFMTFLFAFFMAMKNKNNLKVPFKKPDIKAFMVTILMVVSGIPIAMVLNALAGVLSQAGADGTEDINKYPIYLSILCFAVVPAIVEEYVFRGVILGEFLKVKGKFGIASAVVLSSLFFALLHFSLGSVLYGFFFGCLFALVRIATGNMIYPFCMHMAFNLVNVILSYIDMSHIPNIAVIVEMIALFIIFIITTVVFFREYRIDDKVKGGLKGNKTWKMITKEGYVTMGVCLLVMGMLLMM
ncbi:MAG: CPBP family intramembrane metalloprotease [Lachnospiraceae bacterium]|nr:CPBP family intramembrane metalloprotease [Lachnospiraceae bacterium]